MGHVLGNPGSMVMIMGLCFVFCACLLLQASGCCGRDFPVGLLF